MTEHFRNPDRPRHARLEVTAVTLADITGVEANTVRNIAKELFEILERNVESRGPIIDESGDS